MLVNFSIYRDNFRKKEKINRSKAKLHWIGSVL